MKKIKFLFILAVVFLSSCKKDLLPEPEKLNPCERVSFKNGTEFWLETCQISDTLNYFESKEFNIVLKCSNPAIDIDAIIKSIEGLPKNFLIFPETELSQGYKIIKFKINERANLGQHSGIITIAISRQLDKEGNMEEVILPLRLNLKVETVTP